MKVLVTYISWTGNTKKVAEAIFQGIQAEKELKELKSVDNTDGYSLIFVGFPIHGFGKPAQEAGDFLKNRCGGKKIALFCTHGAPEDSPFIAGWLENLRRICAQSELLGIFNCQGQIAREELEKLLNHPDPQWRERGQNMSRAKGQPDAVKLAAAAEFAGKIIQNIS